MEILTTEKEIIKRFKDLTYKDIKNGSINITLYSKRGQTYFGQVYANFNLANNENIHINHLIKVGGWGYDKHSTALSNGLNLFKTIYKKKTTLKYKNNCYGYKEYYTKDNKRVYGLYKDNSIEYGIGANSVLYAVKEGFSNLKLTSEYYGPNEDNFRFEIKGA